MRFDRARRRSQAKLYAVEVPQHATPLAVDRAVAFVRDHQVEVARREIPVLRDHRLKRRYCDELSAVESASRPEHMAGIVAQVVRKRVFRLPRQRDPVYEE